MITMGEKMKKIQLSEFSDLNSLAGAAGYGSIYAQSVVQGFQQGDVYRLGEGAVVHHLCGFALLCGAVEQAQLEELYTALHGGRRCVLFCQSGDVSGYFERAQGIKAERRLFYEFKKGAANEWDLPEEFEIKEIDAGSISRLDGRITPSFSWESSERFLAKGKGFCVMHGQVPAAWAFSAAVSDDEIDIGVETLESYRGKGLAAAAANEMIRYALAVGKKPVWACHAGNVGSQKVAEKLGFEKVGECFTVAV